MGLTPQQHDFVKNLSTHILLIATAGSGKTTASTEKTIKLIRAGMHVTVVTFTRQAADELRKRISAKLGREALSMLQVGTFHAVVLAALKAANPSPLDGMKLISEADAALFKREALEQFAIDPTPDALRRFDVARARVSDPFGLDAAHRRPQSDPARADSIVAATKMREAVEYYQRLLSHYRLFDFEALMLTALAWVKSGRRLFSGDYILVDEFQDVDEVQLCLILSHARWCILNVVGDDDQSIYGFREGLGYRALREFQAVTGAKSMHLGVNFRCARTILALGEAVIMQNRHRIPKELTPAKWDAGEVRVVECSTVSSEADLVARITEWAIANGDESIGIIARTNRALYETQQQLTGRVNFKISEGVSLWEEEDCAVVLDLLWYVLSPSENPAALEISLIWAGVHATDIDVMRREAHGRSLYAAFGLVKRRNLLSSETRRAVRWLNQLLIDAHSIASPGGVLNAPEVVETVTKAMVRWILSNKKIRRSQANAKINLIRRGESVLGRLKGSLAQRLSFIAMQKSEECDAPVELLTMHGSKGREFDTVVIVQANDDVIPGRADTETDIEEERRILYVAITRARRRLVITYVGDYFDDHSMTSLLAVRGIPYREREGHLPWLDVRPRR